MTLTFAVAIASSSAGRENQPADYFLDLDSIGESTEAQMSATVPWLPRLLPPIIVDANVPLPPDAPFELTAPSLDRNAYDLTDPFAFEFVVRYVGSTQFTFPISGLKHSFQPNMPGFRQVVLSIRVDEPEVRRHYICGKGLYGSESVVSSTIALMPNQTIRVRGGCPSWAVSATDVPAPIRVVTPVAVLDLVNGPLRFYRDITSAAGTPVHLAIFQ